jgi:putative hydrolase of the HAD superfamily
MIRAVIFDMDDTLIDWSERDGDWVSHSRECLRPIHEHLIAQGRTLPDLEAMAQRYSENARSAWDAVCAPEWASPRQRDILANTLKSLEIPLEGDEFDRLHRLYGWKAFPGVKVFQDTVEVLTALRDAGMKIGLVTNTDMPMWMREIELRAFGLLDAIDVRLTAGDVGHLKPHPAPFREALKQLGVEPEETVFVGDRLQDDVIGARAVGMRAVWIRRTHSQWLEPESGMNGLKPNATIHHLRELLSTFDVWYPGWRNNDNHNGSNPHHDA